MSANNQEANYSHVSKNTRKGLAVGRGKYSDNGTLIKPEVKVGDEVIFAKYSGTPVKHQGKDYLILSERDILATIEK